MATKSTDTATKTTDNEPAAAPPPGVGSLVQDHAGRFGLVVGAGREPDTDKGESPEPIVFWFPQDSAAPYGAELTPVLP